MLLHPKAERAQALMAETGLDCRLTLARRTCTPTRGVGQAVGGGAVRNPAFRFGDGGERVSIVPNVDTPAVRARGGRRDAIGSGAVSFAAGSPAGPSRRTGRRGDGRGPRPERIAGDASRTRRGEAPGDQ